MNTDSPLYQHYKTQLAKSPVFSCLDDDILIDMLEHVRPTTWRKGVVAETAALTECFYLIVDGRVKIEHIDDASGNSVTLFLLGPGDGFDVISLLDKQRHDATPIALDDIQLLSTPTQTVRDWINRHPQFNRNFLPYLGSRMRTMENLATDLATQNTVTRLARLILRHTEPDSSAEMGSHPVRLIHDLPHNALAQMIGSTRQVVNRHLQALRHDGVLNKQSRTLAVQDLEALKHKADRFLSGHHPA